MLSQPTNVSVVQSWIQEHNGQLLFFNTSHKEIALALALRSPPLVCGNIEQTIAIGSKTGFRRLCDEIGLPIPEGSICTTTRDTIQAVKHIITEHGFGFIKAKDGTGGTDLQSNVSLALTEMQKTGLTIEEYVSTKLAYFGHLLGDEWVVEKMVDGNDGSVHVYIDPNNGTARTYVLGAIIAVWSGVQYIIKKENRS